ncbi:MAG: serine hydrolase, partial [Bacteroidota bacterium]|nr:serine hydrolase [Bacteroidota bacterium]
MALGVSLLILTAIIYYAWVSLPIMTGFSAKQMCTCTFVSGRDQKDIESNELGFFPLGIVKNVINIEDSSVTSSVLGLAKKRAIYRKGIGCTLINNISEEQLRWQSFIIPETPVVQRDSLPWPYGDKVNDSIPSAVNKDKMNAAVEKAFTEPNPRKKQRTRAVVVLYDGQLITEKYAPGYGMDSKMYGWSMAKSVTSALIATLVMQGKLNVDQPAPVPEWTNADDPRHSISLKNLLQQTSGLGFLENYTKASDVTNMLYKKDDMAAYTARHTLAYEPGTFFNYSSGNSNILSRIIRQTVDEKDYAAYPYNALFYKIG